MQSREGGGVGSSGVNLDLSVSKACFGFALLALDLRPLVVAVVATLPESPVTDEPAIAFGKTSCFWLILRG